ncbi:MAG: DUF4827 domain-containing protein [Prevotella sp.]|nr:DUF4827 domain-containing protein [Prevotella sp.]
MRKLSYIVFLFIGLFVFIACNDQQTYADLRKQENAIINQYLADSNVSVINETQFADQGYTTDVSKNEFVLFASNGVYMQIIRKGCGEPLKDGETATVLCRFNERNMKTDSLQLSNNVLFYSSYVDKMTVRNTSGTFTASFISGSSVMFLAYGSTSVPTGWLVPFTYINLGRPAKVGDEIAKVRLIVPAARGQAYASQSVYPCLYDITFERGR